MTISKFEDLNIWKLGRVLAKEIYELTKSNSWDDDFGFRNQIRRSASSVPDNIAEGFEREGNREFINFLSIAKGSCGECRSQIYQAFDRQYLSQQQFDHFIQQTTVLSVKLRNTINALNKTDVKGYKFKTS